MKYFSISRGHGECTVIRGALEYLYLYPRLLFEEERERSRRVAQTTGVEREYNRLLVAWLEFGEVQGTMCDCLK